MRERQGRKKFSPFEDPTIVYVDAAGMPKRAFELAHLFAKRPEERQAELGFRCVDKYNISPDYVASWITGEAAKSKFELWCKGKNIELKKGTEEQDDPNKIPKHLAADADLINKLSPHLKQIDLARVLSVRRYREISQDDQQYLVYGVYRLIGSYLGPRRYYRREAQTPTMLPLPELPPEIFGDELVANILFESEREAAVPIFNKSTEEGFRYLAEAGSAVTHPLHKAFVQRLGSYFDKVVNLKIPGLREKIAGSQKDIPEQDRTIESDYPSVHQKEYAYRFVNKPIGKVDLLIGDTGTMKTGGAIAAMELAGTKTTLVVCPPGLVKENWQREIKEKYKEDVEVVKIDSEQDLKALAQASENKKPRYIILAYSLLSRLGSSPEAQALVKKIVETQGIDSLVADEVHLAKEYSASCTQALTLISGCLAKDAPRIAMTATGVVNSVEDLDAPVRILQPFDYPEAGDFTRAARNDPTLVSALLHGKGLLTRWTAEGILGDELPETKYRDEAVPLSDFHQALYDYVYTDSTIEAQVKRGMLRQVSLDPQLVRRHYHPTKIQEMISVLQRKVDESQSDRDRQITQERIKALKERLTVVTSLSTRTQALGELEQAYETYLQWKSTEDPQAKLDADFLIRIGHQNLVLWSFFNLSNGIDGLVAESKLVPAKIAWESKDGVLSSKYQRLKEILDELDREGPNKVIIGSGFYQYKVTSGIEDLYEDDELAFLSLYDHLRSWYGDKAVPKIDGTVSLESKGNELAEREQVRRIWRLEPDANKLLQTVRASRLGIDLTIPPTEANKDIQKVAVILLDNPDTDADRVQFVGRVRRKGQKLPIEVITLKTTNPEHPSTLRYGYIDHGISEALEFKRLLSQMVLDGVPLTEEEERKVRSHMSNLRINLYPETPREHLYKKFFPNIRGKGFKDIREFLGKEGFEGLSNADFFATYYAEYDERTLPGHNARVVTEVIRKYQKSLGLERPLIASVGAGSGILQRVLEQGVVNVDMLGEILEVAKRVSTEGSYAIADAARLPFRDKIFDVTDASLMLHWTNNNPRIQRRGIYLSERAIVLQELNRITQDGGLVTLTLPHSYLISEQFTVWSDVLEQSFGFKLRADLPSGLVRATDYRKEPISWMFNLEKTGAPANRFDLAALNLAFERTVDIIGGSKAGSGPSDLSVSLAPLLPHHEFEIVQPGTGKVDKLTYTLPSVEDDIDSILGRAKRPLSTGLDVTVKLGNEEFGLYRRLTREAKRIFGLTTEEAERLSLEAINIWYDSGSQKHDMGRIWSELRGIMQDLEARKN